MKMEVLTHSSLPKKTHFKSSFSLFFIIIHRIHSTTSHFWFSMLKAFYHHQMRVHNRICLWNSLQIWRGKWKIFENCESLRSIKFFFYSLYGNQTLHVMYGRNISYLQMLINEYSYVMLYFLDDDDCDRKVSTRISLFLFSAFEDFED